MLQLCQSCPEHHSYRRYSCASHATVHHSYRCYNYASHAQYITITDATAALVMPQYITATDATAMPVMPLYITAALVMKQYITDSGTLLCDPKYFALGRFQMSDICILHIYGPHICLFRPHIWLYVERLNTFNLSTDPSNSRNRNSRLNVIF